jgi:hypothetical protein
MKKGREQAGFAVHLTFALVSILLPTLNMVQAEAALTNEKMLPLQVNAAGQFTDHAMVARSGHAYP